MEDQKDIGSEVEDIPSDFFDDFNKKEFLEGLSVIDSWDDEGGLKKRSFKINADTIGSVKDLRELIRDSKHYNMEDRREGSPSRLRTQNYKTSNDGNVDDFIKPGSRRDPNKTNEAIKKDKEVKVKEYLAKHLEDDLRPPGTELDDYYNENRLLDKHKITIAQEEEARAIMEPQTRPRSHSRERVRRDYLVKRRSPRRSPRRSLQRSPRRSPRRSPKRSPLVFSDRRSPRRSPLPFSPRRNSRRSPLPAYSRNRSFHRALSPVRRSTHQPGHGTSSHSYRSSRRTSPRHFSHHTQRSRSPERRLSRRSPSPRRRSRSRSPMQQQHSDNFLYPTATAPAPAFPPSVPYDNPGQPYTDIHSAPVEFMGNVPGFPYGQQPNYTSYNAPYEYAPQPMPIALPVPQPVPAPVMTPIHPVAPIGPPQPLPSPQHTVPDTSPYDALAQLVADGKLSQEDYLKLTPNKGVVSSSLDTKTRVMVLNRCQQAIVKLGKFNLPNRLVMNNKLIGPETKSIAPKYCSPLKRQAAVLFHFTTPNNGKIAQQNKQLVDSIITALELEKVISRPKKKPPKNMKDAAVQTSKPYCDVCEVRESTKHYDAGTSIEFGDFCVSTHTQVVEQDLVNSKAVFNPSGSIADGAPISIAHLTPAQLVSQLAARAKTLKQTEPPPPSNQFARRNPHNSYDGHGGQQYNNYNYRY